MENLNLIVAVALAGAAYLYVGRHMWMRLISQVETPEDIAVLVAGPKMSPWLALGRAAMIASWPVWVVVPAVWFTIQDVTRGA